MARAPREEPTRALTDALDGAEAGWELVILDGPQAGHREALNSSRPLVLGSSPEATVPLTDSAVSRRHLELTVSGGRVRAKDLGSTNGSHLAGHRFQEAELGPGSVVRLGETHVQLLVRGMQDALPPSRADRFGPFLGKSYAARSVFAVLERAARTDATVLITGETGTGKEVVAQALHEASRRREGPFVVVDCAALPAALVESELFGHVKGAFTGAHADRLGAFRSAHRGTLFLDELGELPVDLQTRLLRALETQTVKPVGSNGYVPVDVRVVAATHRDLEGQVRARRFRADLFFRLAVIRVHLPPLRERREDIPLLARHFAALEAGTRVQLGPDALGHLMSHDWPGNVRELRNVIRQAAALSPEALTLAAALQAAPPEAAAPRPPAPDTFDAYFDLPFREARRAITAAFELAYARHVVAAADGNVSEAAKRAGLHRNMVHRILARDGAVEDEDAQADR
jgi:two-component system nitrogen regulation response regulator GlnG